jgi:5-formyltetrahydrofolate cyclo-ligase
MSKNNADLIRTRLRTARKTMPAQNKVRQSAYICAELKSWFAQIAPCVVAAFWPMEDEPDIGPLLIHLEQIGMTVVLPVVVKRHAPLEFHRWSSDMSLTTGNFGVMEPRCTGALTPDIVLVPTLGFTSTSDRLGYGGGYYDRTLAAMHEQGCQPQTIGIAWAEGQLDNGTAHYRPQDHDVRLNAILSGQGWLPAKPRSAVRQSTP